MIQKIESIKMHFNIFIKLIYYKLKYGKRLTIGKNNKFRKRFNINIARHATLYIGDNNFWNDDCSINVREKIIIGDKNLFGKNVNIYDHNHVFNNKNISRGLNFVTKTITIGNNNWFGTNVTILSNTEMGNNNVFGAGTIVNSKFFSNKLVKQNPDLIIQDVIYKENEVKEE